jgi:hypothetical protein
VAAEDSGAAVVVVVKAHLAIRGRMHQVDPAVPWAAELAETGFQAWAEVQADPEVAEAGLGSEQAYSTTAAW